MSRTRGNRTSTLTSPCRAVVIWIDWYTYHLARFRGLQSAFGTSGEVTGIELVGGVGVHAGLKFREERGADLPIETLFPQSGWLETGKFTMAVKLWRKLSELNPDIVLIPGYYTVPAVGAAVWALLHRRASVLMTESTEADHQRTGWKELAKSVAIRTLFKWAVTGGVAHARYLEKLGFPTKRIRRFYDVVGNDHIAEGTEALRRAGHRFGLPARYFLFVGRLASEKNVASLIEAWFDYRENGGSWSLVLAGDGPDASMLRVLAEESCWSAEIIFAGHKTSEELLPYFAFASSFVLPSIREPWGLVVNEAMAASLPVIVSSRCGCAEDLVVPNSNGVICDVSKGGELAASLHFMEERSPEELASMGVASRNRIEAYSPLNFGQEIATIATTRTPLSAAAELHAEEGI